MIEVFADVWCPFTHVGLRRIVSRRQAAGLNVALRVKAWPLELVNGAALDGALVDEEVAALRSAVAPDLFTGFDPTCFPTTTLPALALTSLAYEGDAGRGEAVALDLRDALFERGLDIGDEAVLREIANAHDLDLSALEPATVMSEYADGVARSVVGSPYFFVDGAGFFCPTLDIRRVDGRLQITEDPNAFDAFVAQVLEQPSGRTDWS